MSWSLRFHGVGNASATELGSPMATIERDGAPELMIDCGQEALTAYQVRYGGQPDAVFITHVHMDHDNCLEVTIVKGRASQVKELADQLIALRGVKEGSLTMSSTGDRLD